MSFWKISLWALTSLTFACAKEGKRPNASVAMKVSVSFPAASESIQNSRSAAQLTSTSAATTSSITSTAMHYLEPELLIEDAANRFAFKRAFRLFNYKISNARGVLTSGSLEIKDRAATEIDALEVTAQPGDTLTFEVSFLQTDFMSESDAKNFCATGAPGFVRTWGTKESYSVKEGGEISLNLKETGRTTVHMAALRIPRSNLPESTTSSRESKPRAALRDMLTGFIWEANMCGIDDPFVTENQTEYMFGRAMAFSKPLNSYQLLYLDNDLKITTTTIQPEQRNVLEKLADTEILADSRVTAAFDVAQSDNMQWTLARTALVNILPSNVYPKLPLEVSLNTSGSHNIKPTVTVTNSLYQRNGRKNPSTLIEVVHNANLRCDFGTVLQSTVSTGDTTTLQPLLPFGAMNYHLRIRTISPEGAVTCSTFPVNHAPAAFTPDTGAEAIAAGSEHTCAIRGGALFCWGSNNFGQLGLGNGNRESQSVPSPVKDLNNGVLVVKAADQRTCAIVGSNRELKCWGNFSSGTSSGGSGTTGLETPVSIPGFTNVISVSIGGTHTCAIRGQTSTSENGNLVCFSNFNYNTFMYANYNTLRDAVMTSTNICAVDRSATLDQILCMQLSTLPVGNVIPTIPKKAEFIAPTRLTAGTGHVCATAGQRLFCMGENASGQLGNGGTTDSSEFIEVESLKGTVEHAVAFGENTCVITTEKQLQCWGSNTFGQLLESSQTPIKSPTHISQFDSNVSAVAGGVGHICGVQDTSFKCWGRNSEGQLGLKANRSALETNWTPAASALRESVVAVDVAPLGMFSTWTTSSSFTGTAGAIGTPLPSGTSATASSSNNTNAHICAASEGTLKCWGTNERGQLGDGSTSTSESPVTVAQTSAVKMLSTGSRHTCAVFGESLKCWGENSSGQLGVGSSTTQQQTPTSVSTSSLSAVSSLSAGHEHTCAVSAGALWCWGNNAAGQLGLTSTSNTFLPERVLGFDTNVTSVAAGGRHTCAIRNSALLCFGENGTGQLGNGSTAATSSPVTVFGQDVTDVSVGISHSCAIKTGQLFCWGSNASGQLGTNTSSGSGNNSLPAMVSGMDGGVTAVAAGDEHTCAIKNGALYCWGRADRGQIGHGKIPGPSDTVATSSVWTPALILPAGVTSVAAGHGTCAVIYGRELKCWGTRYHGVSRPMSSPLSVVAP